ncbi:conserved membrane hypothetical protein [Hyphomicrobiales bacterium]|nr:conserved membrane hypothetical protein [Hyphomicrobiales bacterium]CAH1701204.1 conserved membrane hypothetical protein [Hyphomicrobiales bacterium]CAI0345168.1 conserved membrane hypothetical protein [Hyphomicrobiales bacterium]
MKTVFLVTIPRILLGLLFLVSAIDGFWWLATGTNLIHPPTSERGLAFEAALQNSGFIWPMVKAVNLIGSLSLLLNLAPAFGLALLAPIMTVILFFHLVLNPQGIPVALIMVALGLSLVFAYRDRYRALFG